MDYNRYLLSAGEKAGLAIVSLLASLLVSWLFYNSFLGMALMPGVYLVLRKFWLQEQIKKQKDRLSEEYMDALKSVAAALGAGYSMENAWKEAQKEVIMLHGKDSLIYPEIAAMNRAAAINIPLEDTLKDFALRAGNEDIYEFAEVFRFAKRSGGNFVSIIETTVDRISGKYETQKEIAVLVAAKKLEQKVMDVIPILILAYLKLTSADYMAAIYGNLFGIFFMTMCLAAYIAAFFFSEKILDIQV